MFKLLLVIAGCLFTVCALAQDLERVQHTIKELTSSKYHGRGAAHEGDQRAADYLEKQFLTAGLKIISNNTYFQSFQYKINTFPGKLSLATDKGKLKTGIDYILKSTSGAGQGKKCAVVYVDSSIFSNDEALQKFLQKDLKNSAVVYQKKYFKEFTSKTPDLLGQLYSAAVIIELQEKKLTMGLADNSFNTPVFEVLASAFPADSKTVTFEVENEVINHTARNVIGMVEGRTKKDSFIVITAHYDHLGTLGKKTYFPGANDNASGVSMLLELAYYYKEHPLEYSVVFIAFAGEESGLLGSSWFVNHPLIELTRIHFLINLDLLGTGDDGIMVVNGSIFKKEYSSLVDLNEQNKLLPAVKMRGEAANSDHYPFYKKNVPCFFIYTLGGVAAYHDVQDVAKTLPLTKYKEVFTLIVLFNKTV
ncbi:MAG: M28 family metallopeptidase [Cytophaga sp.]|uniref:M28 family metallopeptidase n=1 Tax=Cytophaga sp. TaxID=29535 RepID=UPI003F7D9865